MDIPRKPLNLLMAPIKVPRDREVLFESQLIPKSTRNVSKYE